MNALVSIPEWGDTRLPWNFWEKVYPDPITGCWLWTACEQEKSGAAIITIGGKGYTGHLLIARLMFGDDVDPRLIKRNCWYRACTSPYHIIKLDVPHCVWGHKKTPENTDSASNCRECKRIRDQARAGTRTRSNRDREAERKYRQRYRAKKLGLTLEEYLTRAESRRSLSRVHSPISEVVKRAPNISVFGDKPPTEPWRPASWVAMEEKRKGSRFDATKDAAAS